MNPTTGAKTMKKDDLITAVAADTGMTKRDVGSVLDALERIAVATITEGQDFALPGLVRVEIKNRAARMVRNPQTGVSSMAPATRAAVAKVSAQIKRAANKAA